MWNQWNAPNRDDRGSGGPVLRDPLAGRLRAQPYKTEFKSKFHQSQNGNFNDTRNFDNGGFSIDGGAGQSLFPPAYNESLFPPISKFQQEPPPPKIQQTPLLPLLGLQLSGVPPPPPVETVGPGFSGPVVPPQFNNDLGNNSFSFPPPPLFPPPALPSFLPTTSEVFQNSFSGGVSSERFGNTDSTNHFDHGQEPTLNLQPQWSINQNGQSDQVPRTSLQGNGQKGFEFERRPFNPNQKQSFNNNNNKTTERYDSGSQAYERRPNFDWQSSQQHHYPQGPLPPNFESGGTYSKFNSSRTSSNLSYPSASNSQNTRGGQTSSSFEATNQKPIPSLMSLPRSNFAGLKSDSKKGQNQQCSNARAPYKSGPAPSNGNVINITPKKTFNTPLLPTPKLVPYPPPPLPSKSSNVSASPLLRNPRGILKNSSNSSYSNFVKEGDSNAFSSNDNSPVVPYQIGEDDDDEDVEFVPEVQNSESSSSNMTHDFFSDKMVQHFSSILEGKPPEEQFDEFLKYLKLPPDFLSTRVSIVRNLHVMLREKFKNSVLQPYGADFIGIGNSDDSVNVFIDLTGKQGPSLQVDARSIEPLQVSRETLDELLNLIQEDKNHKFFGQIVRRTNFSSNRVTLPVISFIHSDSKVRCNIRLDNYLLVQEAKVIQFVCSLDIRISAMLALARYWSSVHKVLDTPEEDTKNRFITLLVLFFLAHKKIIPTMAHLQSLCVNREYYNNLDIGFCDDYSLVPQNENAALEDKSVFTLSTLSLLKQFFALFAGAKLKTEVVSLWKAEFIPKESFSPELEGKFLQPDLRKRYRYGVNGKLRDKRIDCGSKLCLQDFQDLSENLTISVAEYDVSKFQIECETACNKLETIMSCGSGNLMDLFVVSEYETYGTLEHRTMHKLVYLLDSIADGTHKQELQDFEFGTTGGHGT